MARYDIASIVADGDGYWVATHGNGLYRLDGALQVTGRYDAASNPGLVSDYIRVLKTDSEGRLGSGPSTGFRSATRRADASNVTSIPPTRGR